jgi:parallel beta-helix repeat protein
MAVLRVPSEFPTIADAVAAAASGDTILVAPGEYQEKVRITTDFVRLIADEGRVVLDGNGDLSRAFVIDGAQGVEINGFTIRHYRRAGIAVSAGRFNRLVHNVIHRIIAGAGIHIAGDGNLVWDNDVSGASGDGILVTDSDGNWLVANRIVDNGGRGILILGGKNAAIVSNETAGNQNFGIASTGDNTLLLNNSLIENGVEEAADTIGHMDAVQSGNAVVIGTRILRNQLPGIVLSRRNTFVARNRVKGNSGTGITISATARFNSVQENRVADNEHNGIEVDGRRNLILRNRLRRNTPFDLVLNDPRNDLIDNQCTASDPPGLCD